MFISVQSGHSRLRPRPPRSGPLAQCLYGCFCKLGVLLIGVLIIRALLVEVYIKAPDFWKLPYLSRMNPGLPRTNISGPEGFQIVGLLMTTSTPCRKRCLGIRGRTRRWRLQSSRMAAKARCVASKSHTCGRHLCVVSAFSHFSVNADANRDDGG